MPKQPDLNIDVLRERIREIEAWLEEKEAEPARVRLERDAQLAQLDDALTALEDVRAGLRSVIVSAHRTMGTLDSKVAELEAEIRVLQGQRKEQVQLIAEVEHTRLKEVAEEERKIHERMSEVRNRYSTMLRQLEDGKVRRKQRELEKLRGRLQSKEGRLEQRKARQEAAVEGPPEPIATPKSYVLRGRK